MFIGGYYYEIPTSLPSLNATSFYFVAFCFLAFLLSRPFKSILRPYILLIANVVFVYSFGLSNLFWLLGFSMLGYALGLLNDKHHNRVLVKFIMLVDITKEQT